MTRFEVLGSCGLARRGRLQTRHGAVETPAFMPVGTQASVKGVTAEELETLGYQLVLSNTYHLHLRPGEARVERLGGLHAFMGWSGAILTDSGGYQAMSLSAIRTMDNHGVHFRSHLDGRPVTLTPESVVEIQRRLGVDVAMVLDECAPYPSPRDDVVRAMRRTHDWAQRSLAVERGATALFGIVQGGVFDDLRAESAATISALPFDGVAIGGVSVGEPTELQYPVVAHTAPLLPVHRPRYLMGVGHPKDILHAVSCGVDLFDCVLPTRMARHGTLYTLSGRVNILNAKWAEHDGPFDENSVFPLTERYSAAYIHHLMKSREPLGQRLASLHNLAFYARMMQEIRQAIAENCWAWLAERYRDA